MARLHPFLKRLRTHRPWPPQRPGQAASVPADPVPAGRTPDRGIAATSTIAATGAPPSQQPWQPACLSLPEIRFRRTASYKPLAAVHRPGSRLVITRSRRYRIDKYGLGNDAQLAVSGQP